MMVVNNPDTGADTRNPRCTSRPTCTGNEIQGGEVCLYTIWYLMEHYGKIEAITRLVDERAFYIVPVINPDGRRLLHARAGRQAAHRPHAGR